MHKYFGGALLVGAMMAARLAAQEAPPVHFEVAITYNALHASTTGNGSFWMQGGSAQVEGRFWRGLGGVADVAGMHTGNILSSGVGLDMLVTTFGPRYTWSHQKVSIFGQGLVGEVSGFDSVFPSSSGASAGAHGLAVLAGGGMNVGISPHLSVRAIEADWLRTELPNSTTGVENNLRLGAAIVYRFR